MNNWRNGLIAAMAGLALTACGGGGSAETDTSLSSSSTPGSTTGSTQNHTQNAAPVITGTPATVITAGTTYITQVTASDADGDVLTFTATGLPAWVKIQAQTGQLYGTPSLSDVGTSGNIVISVSDGRATTSLPAFQIVVASVTGGGGGSSSSGNGSGTGSSSGGGSSGGGGGGSVQNIAPTILGTPTLSVSSGASYIFVPTASDPDSSVLGFSISGKPAWASFNVVTGALTGTAQAGTYPNIVISVSDGTNSRSLTAFTLTVTASNTGTATLSWAVPAQNTDGSSLTDLAGYHIYHGTNPSALNEVIQVSGANNTSYAFTQLSSGTHYFAVAAYNSAGVESTLSAVGSKIIL